MWMLLISFFDMLLHVLFQGVVGRVYQRVYFFQRQRSETVIKQQFSLNVTSTASNELIFVTPDILIKLQSSTRLRRLFPMIVPRHPCCACQLSNGIFQAATLRLVLQQCFLQVRTHLVTLRVFVLWKALFQRGSYPLDLQSSYCFPIPITIDTGLGFGRFWFELVFLKTVGEFSKGLGQRLLAIFEIFSLVVLMRSSA